MLFITNNLIGQSTSIDSVDLNQPTPALNFQRLHVSLNVGAGYIGGSGYNSGLFTMVAPSLNYMVSPKLKLEVGSVFFSRNNDYYQMPATETRPNIPQKSNEALVYAQGQYFLSDNLTLTGSFYKSLNAIGSSHKSPYSPDYKGMNFGLDYKITKNISFGAQFRYSSSNHSFFNRNGMGYSPYQRDVFGW